VLTVLVKKVITVLLKTVVTEPSKRVITGKTQVVITERPKRVIDISNYFLPYRKNRICDGLVYGFMIGRR
jgi:hypothetical protein